MYDSEWKDEEPERYEVAIRALTRFTAFIRKNVKEMGEFWFVRQWAEIVPEHPEDMIIIEMNVDDLKFEGEGIDFFQFKMNTFYKFVDE